MALRILSALLVAGLASAAAGSPDAPGPAALAPHPVAESPRLDRVVVAPLNLAVQAPAELEGRGEPVWRALLAYVQQRDRKVAVLNAISAERLWLQATADLDRSDRRAALRDAEANFARELAGHSEFDLLVIPSLVLRRGYLSGIHAAWDGVQREVPHAARLIDRGIGDLAAPGRAQVLGLRGRIAAVSLHVSVLRSDGTEVFQGLGGLDVLQEVRRDEPWQPGLSFATRSDPFADAEAVREGVARAFEGPNLTLALGG